MSESKSIKIAVVDDHALFRKGLINVLSVLDSAFEIVGEFANGKLFLDWFDQGGKLDVLILDVNMPIMDGYAVASHLKSRTNAPKVLSLTMLNDDATLLRLIKSGVRGFLNKDTEPEVLKKAIHAIHEKGQYYTENVAGMLVDVFQGEKDHMKTNVHFTERELEYIQEACTEKSNKEIAEALNVSPRTAENYMKILYEKTNVNSRVGLVLYALKKGLVHLQ